MKKLLLITLTFISIKAFSQTDSTKVLQDDCKYVEATIDKYTGKRTISGLVGSVPDKLAVGITKNPEEFYPFKLFLYVDNCDAPTAGKGVKILLSNGKSMIKNVVEVSPAAAERGYSHSAYITLTNREFQILCENRITDFQLYIYDRPIPIDIGLEIQSMMKCIQTRY